VRVARLPVGIAVQGICYWLLLHRSRCTVRTRSRVQHYHSRFACRVELLETPAKPLGGSTRAMRLPESNAQGGVTGRRTKTREQPGEFKKRDVNRASRATIFSESSASWVYSCAGAGTAFMPYLLRHARLPCLALQTSPRIRLPEALIPGIARDRARATGPETCGANVYQRGGLLHHLDDYKGLPSSRSVPATS